MVKTLVKQGDTYVLVIEKAIRDAMHIDATTPLEITVTGDTLQVSVKRDSSRQARVQQALDKINASHGDDLKRLAE